MENRFDKLLNSLEELKQEIKKTTGINRAGVNQATRLVGNGYYIKPSSWNPPSAEEENAFIEAEGMPAFGKWHLGVDGNVDPNLKGHWTYIYTSDFKTVDRAALIAVRQRAGQQKETAIFEAAGKILEKLDA
jgi:lysophospholipase L1-like esterase